MNNDQLRQNNTDLDSLKTPNLEDAQVQEQNTLVNPIQGNTTPACLYTPSI